MGNKSIRLVVWSGGGMHALIYWNDFLGGLKRLSLASRGRLVEHKDDSPEQKNKSLIRGLMPSVTPICLFSDCYSSGYRQIGTLGEMAEFLRNFGQRPARAQFWIPTAGNEVLNWIAQSGVLTSEDFMEYLLEQ